MCAIAANELRAEWRRRKRREEFLEESTYPSDTEIGDGSDLERAALALCFEHGLTHEEAATVLRCPVGTLKSHVARGKQRLRELLDPGDADVQPGR